MRPSDQQSWALSCCHINSSAAVVSAIVYLVFVLPSAVSAAAASHGCRLASANITKVVTLVLVNVRAAHGVVAVLPCDLLRTDIFPSGLLFFVMKFPNGHIAVTLAWRKLSHNPK